MQRIEKPTLSRMSNMIDSEINLLPKMKFHFDDEVHTPPPLPPYGLSRTCSVGEAYVFTPCGIVYNPDMVGEEEEKEGLYDMHGVIPSYPTEDTIPPPGSSTIYTCLYSVYSFVLGLTEDCCGSDLFHWMRGSSTEDNDSNIQRSTCIDVADDDGYDGPGFDVVAAMKKMIPSEKLKKI